jgi:hypothetical protein
MIQLKLTAAQINNVEWALSSMIDSSSDDPDGHFVDFGYMTDDVPAINGTSVMLPPSLNKAQVLEDLDYRLNVQLPAMLKEEMINPSSAIACCSRAFSLIRKAWGPACTR